MNNQKIKPTSVQFLNQIVMLNQVIKPNIHITPNLRTKPKSETTKELTMKMKIENGIALLFVLMLRPSFLISKPEYVFFIVHHQSFIKPLLETPKLKPN